MIETNMLNDLRKSHLHHQVESIGTYSTEFISNNIEKGEKLILSLIDELELTFRTPVRLNKDL